MKIHLGISIIIILALATGKPARAQDTAVQPTAKAAVQLSETEWKAVEGIFASDQNRENKVRFRAREGILVANLLWNGGEVHLVPSSSLVFISKEMEGGEPLKLLFLRDSAGQVNRLNVEKNGTWTRIKNYQPDPPKKEKAHTPEQLKPFEGLYRFQEEPSRFIQFTVRGNSLILKQHWDNNEISFLPESETGFFAPAIPRFTLDFSKDDKGNIIKVLAFKRDIWIKVNATRVTGEQWKAIEGAYISKDDPDNIIRLTEQNNRLLLTQLWDKKEISLDPVADGYFYNTAQSYSLLVRNDDKGNITGVLILGMDLFLRKSEK